MIKFIFSAFDFAYYAIKGIAVMCFGLALTIYAISSFPILFFLFTLDPGSKPWVFLVLFPGFSVWMVMFFREFYELGKGRGR